MAQTFTNEEFPNVEFQCKSTDANVGWYHECEAVQDGNVLVATKCHYYNRTWERYTYESVYTKCMNMLRKVQSGKSYELTSSIWVELEDNNIIYRYGKDRDNDNVIIFESWEQQQNFEKLVADELEDEAKETLDELGIDHEQLKYEYDELISEYVFDDEYCMCPTCGKIVRYDEMTNVGDYEEVCEDCAKENIDEYIGDMIEKAQDDFRQALPTTVDEEAVEDEGFTYLDFDGEIRMFESDNTDFARTICSIFNGFAHLTGVGQFQTYYKVAVPDEWSEEAQYFAEGKINEDEARAIVDGETTLDDILEQRPYDMNNEE